MVLYSAGRGGYKYTPQQAAVFLDEQNTHILYGFLA